jgi:hypothetical protein
MIPRKWEWVRDQCVRRGLKDAAKLAGEIDAALLDCYDVKHTKDWKVFCNSNNMDELATRDAFFYVVKAIKFCVACQASDMFCSKCSFAKNHGKCFNCDSLFDRFHIDAVKGFLSQTDYYRPRYVGIYGKW